MQPSAPQQGNWTYQAENSAPDQSAPDFDANVPPPAEPIVWNGSEYLDKHKSAGWFIVLFLIIAAICGVVFLFSQDILSIVFIVVIGVLFAIIAARKPRQLQYAIDDHGITVGQRAYAFFEFKSFSIQHEGMIGYIRLMPLKRLQPEIAIYYPPEAEQKIFDLLANHIPHEDHKDTMVDKFTRAIRF